MTLHPYNRQIPNCRPPFGVHEKLSVVVACLENESAASNLERCDLLRNEIISMYELAYLLKHDVEHYAGLLYRDKWQDLNVYKVMKMLHQNPSYLVSIVDLKWRQRFTRGREVGYRTLWQVQDEHPRYPNHPVNDGVLRARIYTQVSGHGGVHYHQPGHQSGHGIHIRLAAAHSYQISHNHDSKFAERLCTGISCLRICGKPQHV